MSTVKMKNGRPMLQTLMSGFARIAAVNSQIIDRHPVAKTVH